MSDNENRFDHIENAEAKKLIAENYDFFKSENIHMSSKISLKDVEDLLKTPKFERYKKEQEEKNQPKDDKTEETPKNKELGNVFAVGEMSKEEAEKEGLEVPEKEGNAYWRKWAVDNKKTLRETKTEEGHFIGRFFDEKGKNHEATINEGKNKDTKRKTINLSRGKGGELPGAEYFEAIAKRVIQITNKNNKKFNKESKPLVIIKPGVSEEFRRSLIEACERNNVLYKDFNPKEIIAEKPENKNGADKKSDDVKKKEFNVDQKPDEPKNPRPVKANRER